MKDVYILINKLNFKDGSSDEVILGVFESLNMAVDSLKEITSQEVSFDLNTIIENEYSAEVFIGVGDNDNSCKIMRVVLNRLIA